MITFHAGPGGNQTGVNENYFETLVSAGVPFAYKSADAMPMDAQNWLEHGKGEVVFRRSVLANDQVPAPNTPDVPRTDIDPKTSFDLHWEWHKQRFPPEMDKTKVWVEVINEVNKEIAEWYAEFALYGARKANAEGYKIAMFGP